MGGTPVLESFATIVDFLALTFSLWLGIYIVSRSPRSRTSWLAGASLWSLSGAALIHLLDSGSQSEEIGIVWWWGWSVVIAAAFWHHLSTTLRPREGRNKLTWLTPAIYFIALNLLAMEAYTPLIFDRPAAEPGSVASAGMLFPLLPAYLSAVFLLAVANLRAAYGGASSQPVRQRTRLLIWVSLLWLIGALWGALTIWLPPVSGRIAADLSLAMGVFLLGYAVGRRNALLEAYTSRSDFLYAMVALGTVTGAYLLTASLLNWLAGAPLRATLPIILLAIVTHSLYDWGRKALDRWIYRGRRYCELRSDLRDFAQAGSLSEDLSERLGPFLQSLCTTLRAPHALLIRSTTPEPAVEAAWGWSPDLGSVSGDTIAITKTQILSPPAELAGGPPVSILVPLQFGGEAIGVLALGARDSGERYSADEIYLLEDLADTVAGVLHTSHLQAESVSSIEALLAEVKRQEQQLQASMRVVLDEDLEPGNGTADDFAAEVEHALRHIHSYSHLGQLPLSGLQLVAERIEAQAVEYVTHLDRGRALNRVLQDALEKLRPHVDRPPSPPGREWHPYLILRDCYFGEKLNREVMAELYIGEGTFHRTRRQALRTIAGAVWEMERAVQSISTDSHTES